MATRSELVSEMQKALQVPKRTLTVCARHLREAGLLSEHGRGRAAAVMFPSDATNLLLGVMATNELRLAPACAAMARACSFQGAELNYDGKVIRDPPSYSFLVGRDGAYRLGDVLDALFDEMVRYGDLHTDTGALITNLNLTVYRPGAGAELHVDDGDRYWLLRYRHNDFLDCGGMQTATSISGDQFWAIADVLRGYQPEEGENVTPPYDVTVQIPSSVQAIIEAMDMRLNEAAKPLQEMLDRINKGIQSRQPQMEQILEGLKELKRIEKKYGHEFLRKNCGHLTPAEIIDLDRQGKLDAGESENGGELAN